MTVMKKPQQKVSLVDLHALSVSLEIAAVAVDPDEYNLRAAFKSVMTKLYVMRQRGMSFAQVHRLLNDVGLPIAASTVRTYYNECLLEMLDECQKYLKRMERVIDDAEKTVVVDRTREMQATKQAFRAAVTEEADRRGIAAISALSPVSNRVTGALPSTRPLDGTARDESVAGENGGSSSTATCGSGATEPEAPKGTSSRGQVPAESLMDSGRQTPQATPAVSAYIEALPHTTKNTPALVAPVVAAYAAPARALAATKSSPSLDATAATGSAYCLTNPTDEQIEMVEGLPPEVLGDAVLEHPAIPGLMLTRNQRLYVGRLEYKSAAGVESVEKGTQMMNRREWKRAVPASVGRTSSDFVELDTSIIGRRKKT